MAFNPNPPKAEYQAGPNQHDFPFLFKIFFNTDIRVFHTSQTTGITTELFQNTDFTLVINGDDGGVVQLLSLAIVDDYYVLQRELDLNRYVEYQTSGDLLAVTLNADQDYQTYLISDQNSLKDNSLHLPEGTFGVTTEIPKPVANNFFKWNSDGTAVEYGASSNLIVAWGNINGTLSDQTDLQNALDLKADNTSTNWIATNNGTWTGKLTGFSLDLTGGIDSPNLELFNTFAWQESAGRLQLFYSGGSLDTLQLINPDSKTLEQTSTDLLWDNVAVITGNASETNVGGIKIAVIGTDCYITTDGTTPGP